MKETLYILSSEVELTKSKDSLTCTRPNPENEGEVIKQKIPLAHLHSIEVYGRIKISTPLLKICNELKIPCYFNTYNGVPIGQFLPEKPIPGIIRLFQYKSYFDQSKKLHIAKAIVNKASLERIRILRKYDKKKELNEEISDLTSYKNKIHKSRKISALRGLEGNFMKKFFACFSKLLYHLPFGSRSQQPPKDEANAIMSYGNVVLYNTVRAVVYRCALDPLIGFLHDPNGNRNSLALDIAEIFRPIIVDNLILLLDHRGTLLPSHFRKGDIKCLLAPKGKKIWLSNYRNYLQSSIRYPPLRRYISIREEIKLECYNLIKYLTEENKDYIPLDFKNI
ncbi:MAG: CRISPR-associated endonuclease Cas1 [Candidatus Lokiarchaeota archaeon]|nr:CRISPR-associated endonuclease Cas1 [Candidatus Lokiarchaeota archaeon]